MFNKTILIVGIISYVLFSFSSAQAVTYYVDPSGDDSNGLSWETAFTSINTAIGANDVNIIIQNGYPRTATAARKIAC